MNEIARQFIFSDPNPLVARESQLTVGERCVERNRRQVSGLLTEAASAVFRNPVAGPERRYVWQVAIDALDVTAIGMSAGGRYPTDEMLINELGRRLDQGLLPVIALKDTVRGEAKILTVLGEDSGDSVGGIPADVFVGWKRIGKVAKRVLLSMSSGQQK